MQEIWKDIPNYEGVYQASNLGRVRSLDRVISYSDKNNIIHSKTCKGVILKQRISNTGYYRTPINYKGIKKYMSIHRLVATTFLDNPDNLPQVNHKDGNRLNNNVNNLEWVSMSQNVRHAYETGLNYGLRGDLSPHKKAVLQYDLSGNFIKRWSCAANAARELGCQKTCISLVCKGKGKTHNGYIWRFEGE